jgi:flagellar motor protein MotB
MVSYLDVLTIMLIFFLVVAARTFAVPASVPVAPSAVRAPEVDRHAGLSRAEILFRDRGIVSKRDERGLVVGFPQLVLFPPGASTLNPQAVETLAQIAAVLRLIPNEVRLVGHADATPIHSRRFHNNWELAIARSQTILEMLSTRFGISEKRLSLASYGDWRPAATNDTADGRATNRRVEFVIPDQDPAAGDPSK